MNLKYAVCIGVLILTMCGCAEKQLSAEEIGPFKIAVSMYLKDKSMEMKSVAFKSLKITADKATCRVTLQDAEGLYSIKPKWQFFFKKTDGVWTVLHYKVIR